MSLGMNPDGTITFNFTCNIVEVLYHQLRIGNIHVLPEISLALTGRGDVCPSRVGKHFPIPDDSYANLIGTAFKPNYYCHGN